MDTVDTVTAAQNQTSVSRIKQRMGLADFGPVLALCLLLVIGSLLSPVFWSKGNIINVLTQISVLGLGALGMTFVVIAGFFDLSIAGILSLSCVLAVGLLPVLGTVGSVITVIGIAVIIGIMNGSILRLIKGDFGASIMITFGTGTILSALALMYTKGFTLMLQEDPLFKWFGYGQVLGLPSPVILMIVCAVILHVILQNTSLGRSIYLTGANPEAARLSGIPIHRIRTITYIVAAVLVAIGGFIRSSQTVSASPVAGVGFELDVIAAVAIGGTSLAGGEGNIIRTMIGVLLIGVLSNLFVLVGLSNFDQMMAKGLIIIAALILDKRKETRGIRRR
ncbi:ABC transporter permease [Paenibacillus validus]